jgi:hypothetical protein
MSGCILLDGPPLRLERAVEVLRAIAPLVFGCPLALQEVERELLRDGNGGSACWRALWRDGEFELAAIVENGPGNPRDGYGYVASAKLMGPYRGKTWWRAEFYGSGYEPELQPRLRLGLLGLAPSDDEAIRARVLALLPGYRDVTLEDRHAVHDLLSDFEHHGHEAWVRDFLAQPLLPSTPWASAALCERKIALRGVDHETARTWLTLTPAASRGWQALADNGGDGATTAEEARLLAALTHPFSLRALEDAGESAPIPGAALAGAMAHVFQDPRWRWIDAADRDAYEAGIAAWVPAPSRRVSLERPAGQPIDKVIVDLFQRAGFASAPAVTFGPAITGAPLAAPGSLSSACGIGTGHSVRRAAIELMTPVHRSHVVAVCHTNCEDRLSTFALAWRCMQQQIVLRTSLTGEPPTASRTPIELDVIDTGDGEWGEDIVARLVAAR